MARTLYSRAVRVSFGVAVGILAWLSLVSLWSTRRLVQSSYAVQEAQEAFTKFQHIEVLMESAQASVASFVISGESDRLNAFNYAKLLVPQEIKVIDAFLQVVPDRREALGVLDKQLQRRLQELERVVNTRRTRGKEAASALVIQESGPARDAWERSLSDVQIVHTSELRNRWAGAESHASRAQGVLGIATLLSLALVGWTFLLVQKENKVRHSAEDEKNQTERFLHSVINRIPYMILLKEPRHLRITLANKAAEEWLGKPQDEIEGSLESDLRPAEEASKSLLKDRETLRKGFLTDMEESISRPGQEPRLLHTQRIPLPNDDGEIVGMLSISEDITQRKQAEQLLALSRDSAIEAVRLRSDFIRNMSHELRTPLSIVIGMTTLLQESTLKPDQKKFADTIRRAAEGLSQLTKNILDFTRMETGTLSFEMREMNVIQITDDIVAMMNEQAKAKKISLVTLASPEVPVVVRGDPTRLRQALTQLVANAVKFTEHGEIRVRLSRAQQNDNQVHLKWQIIDTGIGITPEIQTHVFEPFRQGDGSHTRRYGGTGLGLAMAKGLVELLGGEIGFDSTPGAGSTFWFTVPFQKAHVRGTTVNMNPMPWTHSRVLIVSDNDTTRQKLQEQLKDFALASEMISSGQGAFELLQKERRAGRAFPLVLVDMQLSDMDGVYFAQTIQRDNTLRNTPMVLLTSEKTILDEQALFSMGFSAWISLPCPSKNLYDRLSKWVEPGGKAPRHQAA